jgi:hypothetical protein
VYLSKKRAPFGGGTRKYPSSKKKKKKKIHNLQKQFLRHHQPTQKTHIGRNGTRETTTPSRRQKRTRETATPRLFINHHQPVFRLDFAICFCLSPRETNVGRKEVVQNKQLAEDISEAKGRGVVPPEAEAKEDERRWLENGVVPPEAGGKTLTFSTNAGSWKRAPHAHQLLLIAICFVLYTVVGLY